MSVYVGVIKNNECLLELTKDMPFVSEENTFNSNGPEAGEITYVGNDCFVAMKKSKGGSVSALASYAYMYIAYNVETGKSYSIATSYKNQSELSDLIGIETETPKIQLNILSVY